MQRVAPTQERKGNIREEFVRHERDTQEIGERQPAMNEVQDHPNLTARKICAYVLLNPTKN